MKIFNRKAKFNYHILDTFEAGIVLTGPEVKALRNGRVDLSDSFARIQNGQMYLKNAFIPAYQGQHVEGYQPKHDRKLLMHRNQINSLMGKLSKGGIALIPVSIYTARNMFKVELGLGASKRQVDKRRVVKERDEARRLSQEIGSNY